MLRRYAPLKPSKGTTWPPEIRDEAMRLHRGRCIGPAAGMPGECAGGIELDHIRASGAIGKKSPSVVANAAPLCGSHHRLKTREGRTWRPALIEVVDARLALGTDCGHVDPVFGCPECAKRADPLTLGEVAS